MIYWHTSMQDKACCYRQRPWPFQMEETIYGFESSEHLPFCPMVNMGVLQHRVSLLLLPWASSNCLSQQLPWCQGSVYHLASATRTRRSSGDGTIPCPSFKSPSPWSTDTTQILLNNGLLNIRMDGQRYGRKKTLPLPTNSHLLLNFTKVSRTNQLCISRINLPLKVQIL